MYSQIAHYYDLLHADLTEDIELVREVARLSPGPVLELGSGTGRLLLAVALAGYEVTGVEKDPAMMALAHAKLDAQPPPVRGRITLLEADITHLDGRDDAALARPFQLALLAYNTLMHLWPEEVNRLFNTLHGCLQPAGRLLLDVENPLVMADIPDDNLLALEAILTDTVNNETVLVFTSQRPGKEAQSAEVTWLFDAMPVAGGPVRRALAQAIFYFLNPHELEMKLQAAGFQTEAIYGNYDKTPFTEDSQRLIMVARRGD